jgi:uncharacterized protein YndB with AHSA1/START domain/predicted enzyme related to lactoylglutathione lyase
MSNTTTTTVPALVIRRSFNAPRERLFDAWTTGELLRAWWGPPGSTVTETTFDAREGGRYRLAMTMSDGEAFVVRGVVSEYRKPERLAFSFRWEEDDPALERDTFVSIDFIDHGARTEMLFTHEGFADDASRGRHQGGWTQFFDQLATAVIANPALAIRGIDLSGYMCQDAARAIAFYRDVFGLEPATVYPEGRGAEYELPDGSTFGLWGGGGKVMPFQPSNGILFAVDDLQAAIAALEARGITVNYQTETPNCTMAMIHDTEGNTLTLHQRKTRS